MASLKGRFCFAGPAGAKSGHWARIRDENPSQVRHGDEGTAGSRESGTRHPGGSRPPVGGQDVLLLPGES